MNKNPTLQAAPHLRTADINIIIIIPYGNQYCLATCAGCASPYALLQVCNRIDPPSPNTHKHAQILPLPTPTHTHTYMYTRACVHMHGVFCARVCSQAIYLLPKIDKCTILCRRPPRFFGGNCKRVIAGARNTTPPPPTHTHTHRGTNPLSTPPPPLPSTSLDSTCHITDCM